MFPGYCTPYQLVFWILMLAAWIVTFGGVLWGIKRLFPASPPPAQTPPAAEQHATLATTAADPTRRQTTPASHL